ncbi:MAG: glutamate racemase [Clostridia bacterium]|nr:glutamate racemase [Clostridia bacterium]
MNARTDPIGIFDSGLGGISTLREMRKLLPGEHFIYYGDTGNAPYGTKTREEVLQCVSRVVDRLLKEQIKALVIACNTATSVAAAQLRKDLQIPVIGMEPALKPAHEIRKSGKILVLATPLTLREEKFSRLMSRFGEGAEKVPCEGLVELVEAEDRDGAKRYLETLLAGFRLDEVDAVVLGCTHYVFLRDMIKNMIPDHVAITDGNAGTARQLRRVLAERELLNDAGEGSVRILTSGTDTDLQKMNRLLQNADT